MNIKNITAALLALLGLSLTITVNVFVRVEVQHFGLTEEGAIETREAIASLPVLSVVGSDSDEANQQKRVVLDSLLLKANNGEWPFHGPQETGDCSAFAAAYAVELDQAGQIENGAAIEFQPVNRQWLYAGGRWQGERQVVSGEGSIPSLQIDFMATHGVLFQSTPGAPPYSGRSSKAWGNSPPKIHEFPETRDHLVTSAAKIPNAQSCCNAINAGYPVMFGSMRWGTSDSAIKLVEGRNVARDNANWPHAQVCTGYDGTVRGQRLFRIQNSWGENVHRPHSQMPGDRPGGYYVTWDTMDAICKEGMAFAISGTQGFEKREFEPDWTPIGLSAPPLPDEEASTVSDPWISSEGVTPDAQLPGTVIGLALLVVAAFVALRGNVKSRIVPWAAMLILAANVIPTAAQDLDFSFLMTRGLSNDSSDSAVASAQTTNDAFAVDWSALSLAANSVPASESSLDIGAIMRAACVDCECEVCDCIDCKCASVNPEKLLNGATRIIDTAMVKITDQPTHTGTLRPGMLYEWRDGSRRPTPQPGVDYPTVGVYAVGSKRVQLQQAASGRWVCGAGGCYWVNN